MTYDIIIIGAGPAGVSAAYDLNQLGYKVLIIDRHEQIKQKACAGGLTQKSIEKLRFDISEVTRIDSNQVRFNLHNRANSSFNIDSPGTGVTLTVRHELDKFCLKKTLETGVDFRCEPKLTRLSDDHNLVHLYNHLGDKISAKFIIGADGAKSRIRKLLNIERKPTGFAIEGVASVAEYDRCRSLVFDFNQLKNGYGWLFPKGDHVNIGLYSASLKDVEVSKQILTKYAEERFGVPRFDHIIGAPLPIDGQQYRPEHPRIFLIGDAAGFAESFLGEGIHNAIHSGQIVASAIDRSLRRNTNALTEFNNQLASIRRNQLFMNTSAQAFHTLLPHSYLGVKTIAPTLKKIKDSLAII